MYPLPSAIHRSLIAEIDGKIFGAGKKEKKEKEER